MYKEIAKQMVDEYTDILDANLKHVDDLCRKAGGRLISRQAIALIIHQYQTNRCMDHCKQPNRG
jgi:hypothetical protein